MRFLAIMCLLQMSCAARVTYSSAGGERRFCLARECYQLGRLGSGWTVVQRQEGAIGLFNPESGAVIQSNAVCREDISTASLQSLTNHALIGYTERKVRSASILPLVQREALRTVIDVKLDGVPMVLDLYVFKRNGCLFDLSFAAAPDRYDRGAVEFQRFVADFHPSPARAGP